MKPEKNYVEIIERKTDLARGLSLVQRYFYFVDELNKDKIAEIAYLNSLAQKNIDISEKLLDGFTRVKFISKDGKVMITSPDSDKEPFYPWMPYTQSRQPPS